MATTTKQRRPVEAQFSDEICVVDPSGVSFWVVIIEGDAVLYTGEGDAKWAAEYYAGRGFPTVMRPALLAAGGIKAEGHDMSAE